VRTTSCLNAFDFPQDGPLKARELRPSSFKSETYYHLMGWDKDGVPTKASLIGLTSNGIALS
jgi:hypothetical protein